MTTNLMGIEIIRESTGELMDTLPGDYLSCNIDALIQVIEGVIKVEDVRGHRFGPYLVLVWKPRRAAFHSRRAVGRYGNLPYFPDRNYLVLNVTIGVDGGLSVSGSRFQPG